LAELENVQRNAEISKLSAANEFVKWDGRIALGGPKLKASQVKTANAPLAKSEFPSR
jgi:hypothetical protein